jgi:hypothetical protein
VRLRHDADNARPRHDADNARPRHDADNARPRHDADNAHRPSLARRSGASASLQTVFHVELRADSDRLHRLNLNEQELLESLLEPWVRGESIEMGDHSWSAAAGSILVLEGPEIPVGRLTMGRGWSVAQSEGTDVTGATLDRVREAVTAAAAAGAMAAVGAPGSQVGVGVLGLQLRAGAPADADVLADALGLELLRSLRETPMSLLAAWRIAVKRHPQLPIGVSLELAQRAVASLVRSRLIVLGRAGDAGARDLKDDELDSALQAIDSWIAESGAEGFWFRRT